MVNRLIVSDEERDAVLKLDAAQRYSYFVKRVADWEAAWGLWEDGWALVGGDDGRTGFPLWPAREYAWACAAGEWAGYRPGQIAIGDLVGEVLSRLQAEGVLVGVFPTPTGKGMLVEPNELGSSLRAECERYE